MYLSISSGAKNVCIDDSGITITSQFSIPGWKTCSIEDALEVVQRGKVVNTTKIDANNTLALVETSMGDGFSIVFGSKGETRYTFMGRKAFEQLFATMDAIDLLSEEEAFLDALDAFKKMGRNRNNVL